MTVDPGLIALVTLLWITYGLGLFLYVYHDSRYPSCWALLLGAIMLMTVGPLLMLVAWLSVIMDQFRRRNRKKRGNDVSRFP